MDRWRAKAHARAWRDARGFQELCELAARFVAGELRAFPGWGAERLDDESRGLVPALLACNRGGFLTVVSQPGYAPRRDIDGRVRAQRAFVGGFASERATRALRSIASEHVWIREERPGVTPAPGVAVASLDGATALVAGGAARREELALFARAISPEARAELAALPFVWAIHLAWEEDGELWSALERGFSPAASTAGIPDGPAHTRVPLP